MKFKLEYRQLDSRDYSLNTELWASNFQRHVIKLYSYASRMRRIPFEWRNFESLHALLSCGYGLEMPQTGDLKTQKCVPSLSRGSELDVGIFAILQRCGKDFFLMSLSLSCWCASRCYAGFCLSVTLSPAPLSARIPFPFLLSERFL